MKRKPRKASGARSGAAAAKKRHDAATKESFIIAARHTPWHQPKMDPARATFELQNHCFQYQHERNKILLGGSAKFAHYTTAENALKIIQGKSVWLRNAALMNDFSEIQHGRDSLHAALNNTDALGRLTAVLDAHHAGLFPEVIEWLNRVEQDAKAATYVTALAEHDADDESGVLSMWRAYGGNTAGVALVLNVDFFSKIGPLGAVTSPVLYGGASEVAPELMRVIEALEKNPHVIAATPRKDARSALFNALRFAMLSTKHPGFREEREWRVLHSPGVMTSEFVKPQPFSIRGIPQLIYAIPLENLPGMNMPELELDHLIHRVIIGPTQFPAQVAEALCLALTQGGVKNAQDRIKHSGIPLRHVF